MFEKKQIQKLTEEIKRLKALVYKDELTGLYSHRGFKEEVKKFLNKTILFKNLRKKENLL